MTEMNDPIERAKVLLKAAHQILNKCDDSPYVENALEMTADYDGTECDGFCLKEDIEHWFEFEAGEVISND